MRSSLRRRVAATAAAAATLVCLSPASSAVAGASPTSGTGSDPTLHSIVAVLRDQLQAQPATHDGAARRASSGSAAQNTVLRRLAGRTPTDVRHFVLANAFAATVTGDQVAALRLDPAVASVGDNATAQTATATTSTAGPSHITPSSKTNAAAPTPAPYQVPANACGKSQSAPLLEPEGLQVIGARSDDPTAKTAAKLGYDGTGVKVGFVADHLDPTIADFRRRSDGTSAIVENTSFDPAGSDVPGDGAEAFGDAGTLVAQGRVAHDLADFVNPAAVTLPGGHCWIRVEGVAPGASAVALSEAGDLTQTLQAIDHAVTVSHVDVLNESFGVNAYPEASAANAIAAANTAAAAAGVTVVASSGDAGVNSTIGSPAASSGDGVIAVGASTHLRAQVQIGGNALSTVGATSWSDDQISAVSSSGTTSGGHTVDLVAPGYGGWAPCSTDLFRFNGCGTVNGRSTGAGIEFFNGTSQAAPFTAGTAALVIQAFRASHHGQSPTPAAVQQILTSTATDLRAATDQQGAGRVNARAAVEAALNWTGTTGAPPSVANRAVVAPTADQLTVTGAPGSTVQVPVTYRNTSARPVRMTPTLRTLDTVSTSSQQLTLTPDRAVFVDLSGQPMTATTTTVTVPAGTDRLRIATSAVPPAASTQPWVGPTIALYDPSGTFVNLGLMLSRGNSYNETTADRPTPGKWTVVVSEAVGAPITSVQLSTGLQQWQAVPGSVVTPPAAALSAGGTGTVTVAAPVIGKGTTAYTLDPGLTAGTATVGPALASVVVQAQLAPTTVKPVTFTAQLAGGNGRSNGPAQTLSYLVQVPTGAPTLSAELKAPDCGCELVAALIDPTGQVRSTGVNELNGQPRNGLSQTVAAPAAGSWRYVILETFTVERPTAAATLRGTLSITPSAATAALPDSSTATLTAGQAVTFPVTVTNPSKVAPIAVLLDAQRTGLTTQALQTTSSGAFTLPFGQFGDDSAAHQFLVPPGTTSITAVTSATTPVQTAWQSPLAGTFATGAPSTPTTASSVTVSQPGQGPWVALISQVGPFPTVAPSGTGTITAIGVAPALDKAISSAVGTAYGPGDQPPVVVPPGASVQVQVTITPPVGAVGRTISGRLVFSTAGSYAAITGQSTGLDVLAFVPYRYTIAAPEQH